MDLCDEATVVVVATVEEVLFVSPPGDSAPNHVVVTHVIQAITGQVEIGSKVEYATKGYPTQGSTALLFLHPPLGERESLTEPLYVAAGRRLTDERVGRLPAGSDMAAVWAATCSANPQGVQLDYQFDWVFPAGVGRKGFGLIGWTTIRDDPG